MTLATRAPIEAAAAKASIPRPPVGYADAPHKPRRVLVVEDDDEMRRLLVASLRGDGYEVVESANGMDATDALAPAAGQAPFDLVVSDFQMPGSTGLSVLADLRESDWVTPFILITAFGQREVFEQALREGASAVFDKPFDLDTLSASVRMLLGTPGTDSELEAVYGDVGGEG